MPSPRAIPVTVLTGFLGSGKTTLLNRLLRDPRMANALVIVNEFGEIALDHEFIEGVNEETVLLQNGCLCCTVRNDLVDTLRDHYRKRAAGAILPFDRVLVETTGLADPAPILQTLMADAEISTHYRLNGVVATVDSVLGQATLDRHVEALRQAAVAERLVLTKSDLAGEETVASLKRRLATINPTADIDIAVMGAVDPTGFFDLGLYDLETKSSDVRRWLHDADHAADGHDHAHSDAHDDDIGAVCVALDQPVDGEALDRWLQTFLRDKGQDLLRFKAIVNVRQLKGPLVLHAVQHVIHPPVMLPAWPSAERRSRFVFIGHGLAEDSIRASLENLVGEVLVAQ